MGSMASLSMASRNSIGIFSFRNPRPQSFPFSFSIMKYMCTNLSSGKAWKKLIQICKYFFSNYPVYPVHHLLCFGGERSSLSGSTPGLWSPNITFNPWEKTIIDFKFAADGEAFDLKDKIANLWIYNELDITMLYDQYYVKKLFSKIVLFNAEIIILYYQYLSWDEYQFLTSTAPIVKRADICHCIIRNSDDSMVTFDKLLETFKDLISL
uniref:Uncharacterized protein n=1 Tax=Panagrolaimus superbus TaxID=310955 RepID=A0A914Z054_9BILA